MELRIEAPRRLDALPTLALHREVLEEGRYFITRPDELHETVESRERRIKALAEDPHGLMLVARRPRVRVAGFVTIEAGSLQRMRHVGKLEIMVGRVHRGLGIGAALLDAALDWARQTPGLHKVGLAVFADNEGALALYRSRGFEEEGRRHREYREADGTWRDDVLLYRMVD